MRSMESSKMLTTRLRSEFVILCIVPEAASLRRRGSPLDQLWWPAWAAALYERCSLPALQRATDTDPCGSRMAL